MPLFVENVTLLPRFCRDYLQQAVHGRTAASMLLAATLIPPLFHLLLHLSISNTRLQQ